MAAKNTSANGYANSLLALIFNGTTYTGIAQNVTSGAVNSLWIALHTASLTGASNQNTTESTYGAYTRVAVTRSTAGWTVASGNSVSPAATITFPTSTAGETGTISYFSIGLSSTGSGQLLYYGTVSPNIFVSGSSIIPELTSSTAITES